MKPNDTPAFLPAFPPVALLDFAWESALEARDAGEVPVGCLICECPDSFLLSAGLSPSPSPSRPLVSSPLPASSPVSSPSLPLVSSPSPSSSPVLSPSSPLVSSPPPSSLTEEWRVIARERNRILERRDATAHAELLAVRAACAVQNSERLSRSVLITTLEPCLMCAGAVFLARLLAVFFFAPQSRYPGLQSALSRDDFPLNHRPLSICVEPYREKSSLLLREFFNARRAGPAVPADNRL